MTSAGAAWTPAPVRGKGECPLTRNRGEIRFASLLCLTSSSGGFHKGEASMHETRRRQWQQRIRTGQRPCGVRQPPPAAQTGGSSSAFTPRAAPGFRTAPQTTTRQRRSQGGTGDMQTEPPQASAAFAGRGGSPGAGLANGGYPRHLPQPPSGPVPPPALIPHNLLGKGMQTKHRPQAKGGLHRDLP